MDSSDTHIGDLVYTQRRDSWYAGRVVSKHDRFAFLRWEQRSEGSGVAFNTGYARYADLRREPH